MIDDERDAFAEALIAARQSGRRFTPTGPLPRDRTDAYAIQSRVVATLGPVGGFKTARRSGEAPIMAPILASDVVRSGASVPVADRMGVELEVGFRLCAPLPARPTDDDLRRCLEPVAVVELVAMRIEGDPAEDPVVRLADNQMNAGLVVGETAAAWDGADLGTVGASMRAGDEVLIDGDATVPGGSAIGAIRNLLEILGTHCGGLQTGQIVITGTLHPLTYVRPGTAIRGRIEGIGGVRVDLASAQTLG